MSTLCKNLKITIELNAPARSVIVTLANPLDLQELQIGYMIGQTTPESEAYHIREAIVIAMRRLVGTAIEADMIKIPGRLPDKDTVVSSAKLTRLDLP